MNVHNNKITRADRHVLQPIGDRVFLAVPLLPNPPVDLTRQLREITGYARNRRFRFEPYLRLFEDTEEIQP